MKQPFAGPRAHVLLFCLALTMPFLCGPASAEDPSGIWVHEPRAVATRAPSGNLVEARFDPLVIRAGLETFSMFMRPTIPTDVVEVRVHVGWFTQAGLAVDPIVLHDDGLAGDAVAGDGLYSAAGLAFVNAPDRIGKRTLRTTTVDFLMSDMSVVTFDEDLGITVHYIDLSVPIPPVATLRSDVATSPHVVSIQTGLMGSFPSQFVDIDAIGHRYYDFFPDDRDFLFMAHAYNTALFPAASFGIVRNDIQGIGVNIFDDSSDYGSNGKLQGVMNLYFGNVFSNLLNHELLHRWAAYLDPSLDLNAIAGSFNVSHWGAIEQSSAGFGPSQPYAGAFDHLAFVHGETYQGWHDNNVQETHYGDLELYLMGLIGFNDLPSPIGALVNPVYDRDEWLGGIQYFLYKATSIRDVPTSEIVMVEGARVPDAQNAQTSFRSALIVITNRLLTPTEFAYWEYGMAEFEQASSTLHPMTFQQATGDRAQIETYVPLFAGTVPDGTDPLTSPLRVNRTAVPGYITVLWDPSCRSSDTDYILYQGEIGDFQSHVPVVCSTNGSTARTFFANPASSYYLAVPRNGRSEGSYGLNSRGLERAPNRAACLAQDVGECTP